MALRDPSSAILFAGRSCPDLGTAAAKAAGIRHGRATIKTFSDGETYVNLEEEVTDATVFVLQSGYAPANDRVVELCLMLDAASRAGAREVVALVPFFPYRRQDRAVEGGEPVSSHVVARCLEAAGAQEVAIVDLHHPRLREYFTVPLSELSAFPLFAKTIQEEEDTSNMVILAPDAGSRGYAERIAQTLPLPIVQATKKRTSHDVAEVTHLDGDVCGKDVLIVDDEVNTAGTLVANVEELLAMGARSILFAATHPVLSGPGVDRLLASPITRVYSTDSIPLPPEKKIPKLTIVSVAPLLAEYIQSHA